MILGIAQTAVFNTHNIIPSGGRYQWFLLYQRPSLSLNLFYVDRAKRQAAHVVIVFNFLFSSIYRVFQIICYGFQSRNMCGVPHTTPTFKTVAYNLKDSVYIYVYVMCIGIPDNNTWHTILDFFSIFNIQVSRETFFRQICTAPHRDFRLHDTNTCTYIFCCLRKYIIVWYITQRSCLFS